MIHRFLTFITLIGALIMFNGCTSHQLSDYQNTKPEADIKTFFNGPIKGWGIIQDRKGRIITRFDVDMVGKWDGNKGILDEQFRYYDGKIQERIWRITKREDGTYEGTADDILNKATGEQEGTAVNWKYQMDVPVDGKTYRMTFDDWMWQMNDGVMVNRSYLKKFGITFAELTLFMQKQ